MKAPSVRVALTSAAGLAVTFSLSAGNWPGWRGPTGTGVSTEQNLPVQWSTTQNVRWRVDLPERGNSSPIVWGNRVFVTQAVSGDSRRTLMCFDRKDGKLLWQSGVTYKDREQTQRDNPYCSATPVTDGERVIASFGSAGLYCYDFEGKELWHRELGKMQHMFGNAASPVIVGDLCVLNFGPDEKARLVAVNKRTGEPVWEAQPPKVEIAPQGRGGGGDGPGGGGPGGGGGGRGGGGPGGGGGGFGPGNMLAARLLADGDKDKDQKLTSQEFTATADAWFDKLDTDKAGKLDQEAFAQRLGQILPAPAGGGGQPDRSGAPGDGQRPEGDRPGGQDRRGGGRGGFGGGGFGGPGGPGGGGGGGFIAPGLFTAVDANKDGSVTRDEWKATFTKWFADWDTGKAGTLDEGKLRDGLNAALPRPQFGGGGGPGGPGGPGGGRGGRGGGGMGGGGGGASWSTPILITANGRQELVITQPGALAAYDPKTGQQLWFSKGLGGTIYTTPVYGENALFAVTSGPGGGAAIAVKPGGNGDVTETQRLWQQDRFKSGIGSGVIREGHLYSISQDGIASCTELQTGKTVWEERLKSSGSRGSSWSSMLLVGDRIYVPNQNGDVFVLKAAPKFELIATNAVGESTNASLAASDGELFLRTDKSLWCFAAGK